MQDYDIDHVFTYHSPTKAQREKYKVIREAAKKFSHTILDYAPKGIDRRIAIRHVREAVMNANAAIALDGRLLRQSGE